LAYALRFGHRPFIFEEDISWDCFIADKGLVKCSHQPHDAGIQGLCVTTLDKRLHNALRDLHAFSCISNVAYQTTRKLSPELYNEMIISIMYRLMHLSFEDDALHETIRIGLLAFAVTIFMRRYFLEEPYEHLLNLYNDSLSELLSSTDVVLPVPIMLWLTILSHVITDKESLPEDCRSVWLDKAIILAGTETWLQACDMLRSVAWVGFIHDSSGKRAFDAARFRLSHSLSRGCELSETFLNCAS
jgi:hypothetical protein